MNTHDWRKQAAQAVADNDAIEKAFLDQAYGHIANRAAPLMKAPYRLGFEVVFKNDTNSRMVGIFAFRIGRDLFYAPVFFLNGEIKGYDLFYAHTNKRFVPLNEKWVKYFLEKSETDEGKGVHRNQRKRVPNQVDFDGMAYPPSHHRKAAAQEAFKEMSEPGHPLTPLLKDFILQDGGVQAFDKVASYLEKSHAFAEALVLSCPEDHWNPPELLEQVKAANAAPVPKLWLYTKMSPEVPDPETFFKQGYSFRDNRGQDELTTIYETDSKLQTIGEPGFYDVLMADGEMAHAFCGYKSKESLHGYDGDSVYPSGGYALSNSETCGPKYVVVLTGDSKKSCCAKEVWGTPCKEVEALKEEAEVGKSYRVYSSRSGEISDPFYVEEKTSRDGIDIYKINMGWCGIKVKRNPDSDTTCLNKGILGSDSRFIEVSGGKKEDARNLYNDHYKFDSADLGTVDNLNDWIMESGIKRASVIGNQHGYTLRTGRLQQTPYLDKLAMTVALAERLSLSAEDAQEVVDKATDGRFDFFMEFPESKSAALTRVLSEPKFQDYENRDFGVLVEQPQGFVIPTETDIVEVPRHRIGDAWDPTMGNGGNRDTPDHLDAEELLTMEPEQLAQLGKQRNVPHLMEHGLVGSLVNTYDAISMVDKYIPKMEAAVDVLGRTVYLCYWKPGDFQDAYGVDDMQNTENELLSNFRSMGDLTLNLLKKSKTQQVGSVAYPN